MVRPPSPTLSIGITGFKEASVVLKPKGRIIIGFIDKHSIIGKMYREKKSKDKFYRHARFKSVDRIIALLKQAGFQQMTFYQTLPYPNIKEIQPPFPGYGKGSFVVVKAVKR